MDLTEVKRLLKTYCKQNHYKSPKYKIVFITEEDYKKLYTTSVEIKDVLTIADSGISRRISEKKAAIKALVELKVINKEDVDNTEEPVVVIENKNDINTKPEAEDSSDNSDEKLEINNNNSEELEPIIKVRVNEVSENTKNIVLSKPSAKLLNKGNDIKFIDENFNFQPKKTLNLSTNENKVENKTQNNEQHLKNENMCELDENPICGLIKYCLRNGIPLPFYDFSFKEGQFATQCRVESNGTEFVGFGRASTLRVAKMVASKEIIDDLKRMNLYLNGDEQKGPVVETECNMKSTGNISENKYTEYSSLTINMKSTERKTIEDNFELHPKTIPTKENFEDFEDFDRKNYSSTLDSRDDNNNNRKDNRFNTIDKPYEQNYNLIIDNPIEYLQKYCSKNKLSAPKYNEEGRAGQDHCPLFWFKCSVETKGREIICIGGGNSKKSAKKAAAEEVVRHLLNI